MTPPPVEVPTEMQVSGEFIKSTHGQLGCRTCHGGKDHPDQEVAHVGLILDPAHGSGAICGQCHQEIVQGYQSALHTGERMQNRFLQTTDPTGGHLVTAFYQHEYSVCHASCGDCHVKNQEGLHTGHEFRARPVIVDSCMSCHLRGAAGELIGKIDGITTIPDVHYAKQGFDCLDCHSIETIHGSNRLTGFADSVDKTCLDCHQEVYGSQSPIEAHRVHPVGLLDCQVCHALPVENCYNCHLNPNGSANVVTRLQLKIGKNPDASVSQQNQYSVVRHIPTRADLLADFREGLLPNYAERPDWRKTSPHNIQRNTPQNRGCVNCHETERYFLTPADEKPEESAANQTLFVDVNKMKE